MHEHDKRWIAEQIQKMPAEYRERARTGYAKAFQEAFDAEPVEHKKENAARFAANTRLREYVKKVNDNER